ncbi:MAG: [FeFe] hydrogenase H-cluster radical SAM maturase HydE [Elusimicrobiaceae bacterium]
MNREKIISLLSLRDQGEINKLFHEACLVRDKCLGGKVYFRGLIEISNICGKNCYYCGIRRDNAAVNRYAMSSGEIVDAASWAYINGYGSVVLQSGEMVSEESASFIETLITEIMRKTDGKLGITLSLGEQPVETYLRWKAAGASRYLLRIETSSPELYAKLHPPDHSFERRIQCLENLKAAGYQLGTGVMIGLPFQTIENLADDLLFFEKMDVDMLGMGPYIVHEQTPLAGSQVSAEMNFDLSLLMIAVARIMLKDVNIAATTALQAINPRGRELGLEAGANVIMPNLTPVKYRADYKLYEGKPCLDEDAARCKGCLERRIRETGMEIGYFEKGDPVHFEKRKRA